MAEASIEIDRLVTDNQRTNSERDEFLRLLVDAQGNALGRYALRWKRYASTHRWAHLLISRPSGFLWSVVTLRKPGFIRVNPLFEASWYMDRYPDVPRGRRAAWLHYRRHGVHEGRDPNPWFETAWYLSHNPDVASTRQNPLDHFLTLGWREGRDPSPRFDCFDYMRHHPDCVVASMNPLLHFLRSDERATAEESGAVTLSEPMQTEAIEAHLDSPPAGSTQGKDAVVLEGWAWSEAGIESVTVYLGATLVGDASLGQRREDVAKAHPGLEGASTSGFSLRVSLAGVQGGRQTLKVIIRDGSGAMRTLLRSFVRVTPEPVRVTPDPVRLSQEPVGHRLRASLPEARLIVGPSGAYVSIDALDATNGSGIEGIHIEAE